MTLPDGVRRLEVDSGEAVLATCGEPIGDEGFKGEPVDDDGVQSEQIDGKWRRWDPNRSKLAAMLELGMDTGLAGGETVLYLGAAAGTTVSHVADFAGPTYAVEFAPGPTRELLERAESRERLFPLLKDARKPETYAHVVEPVDCIVQDVATRGQARVARLNRRFLADDGRLLLSVKARSEDATREPDAVFDDVLSALQTDYEVLERRSLEQFHHDHLGVVARPLDGE